MPELVVKGAVILYDPEDQALVESATWFPWRAGVSQPLMAITRRWVGGKKLTFFLHREIAGRMKVSSALHISAKSGDYLDCRRENIAPIRKKRRKTKRRVRLQDAKRERPARRANGRGNVKARQGHEL